MYSYRKEASRVLKHLLLREDSRHCVIALPPSGLMDSYWKVVKAADGLVVVLQDRPENILKRITFYDIDSRPIQKNLTEREKHLYLQEIKKDIAYFARTYRRADLTVDIADLGPDEAARKVQKAILARTSAL